MSSSAQGLFLGLCSAVTLGGAQGNLGGTTIELGSVAGKGK